MAPNARRAAVPTDAHRRLVELAARYGDDTLGAPSRFFPAPPPPVVDERPDGEAWARAGVAPALVVGLPTVSPQASRRPSPLGRQPHRPRPAVSRRAGSADHGRPPRLGAAGPGGSRSAPSWSATGWPAGSTSPCSSSRSTAPALPRASAAARARARCFRRPTWCAPTRPSARRSGICAAWPPHLRARGASAIGAMGMSLGGYTTALWASLDRELAFAVAMIPAVDLSALLWRHGDASPTRRQAAAAGVSAELLAEVFAVHAPTTRPCLVPPAGAHDRRRRRRPDHAAPIRPSGCARTGAAAPCTGSPAATWRRSAAATPSARCAGTWRPPASASRGGRDASASASPEIRETPEIPETPETPETPDEAE
jgi:hypothetical protein